MNLKFEENKMKQQLRKSGTDYVFKRKALNRFGEKSGYEQDEFGKDKEINVRGIYHEVNSHIKVTVAEGEQYRTKKIPMILTLFADLNVKKDDEVIMNGKLFIVTGVVNVQEWSIIADISLEEVDTGV